MKHLIKIMSVALFMAVFTLFSAGCSDNPTEAQPSITGSWSGTTPVQGTPLTLSLQIVENGGNVNATGTLTGTASVALTATGTYNFPSVSMTLRSSGFQDANFNGTLSAGGNSITGSMNALGGGVTDNFSITLNRQ